MFEELFTPKRIKREIHSKRINIKNSHTAITTGLISGQDDVIQNNRQGTISNKEKRGKEENETKTERRVLLEQKIVPKTQSTEKDEKNNRSEKHAKIIASLLKIVSRNDENFRNRCSQKREEKKCSALLEEIERVKQISLKR